MHSFVNSAPQRDAGHPITSACTLEGRRDCADTGSGSGEAIVPAGASGRWSGTLCRATPRAR